ncbi:Inositol-pentakisphosphate 2-kinase [Escovopsis weberi]|uniref:Inositol-pentakisphosphate 2-kinase n=1 Tax=Escovopsis weberi TaxID=150374 RepID=A0A0M9VVS9_ESCWE|nr:Inositol-pentakisphosphate 2-kinase [Escovopsis weberi]
MAVQPPTPLPTTPPAPKQDPAAPPEEEHSATDDSLVNVDVDVASLLSFLSLDKEPTDPGSPYQSGRASPSTAGSAASDPDEGDISWMTFSDMAVLKAMAGGYQPSICAKCQSGSLSDGGSVKAHKLPALARLPQGTKIVKFVGEGTANAVFEIAVPPDCPTRDRFEGKLLRVAKVASLGETPTYDYTLQQGFYYGFIKSTLGEYAVDQELVVLHNSGIIDELNALLQDIDHTRKPIFQGSYVGLSNWGLLVEDMRPGDDDSHILIEFKPKWLLQSPSAPPKAIRCRQCALDFRKFLLNPIAEKPCPQRKPCPLALGNPTAPKVVRSPFRITNSLPGVAMADKHFEAALAKIMDHDVIHLLRREQGRLDKKGPLHVGPKDQTISLAMTLRDCTLFALIPVNNDHADDSAPIKVRLCDFDWKDPKVKAARWSSTEKALIEEGFYTADWLLCRLNGVDTYHHPPTLCTLECTRPDKALGLYRGLDLIVLEPEDCDPAADARSVKSIELTSPLGAGSVLTVHTQPTDPAVIEAVQEALREYKKEPEDTPLEATYNRYRPFLI